LIIGIEGVNYNTIHLSNEIELLFKELVRINKPFYACLADPSQSFPFQNDNPGLICLLNYWSKSVVHKEALERAKKENFVKKMEDGYYIRQEKDLNKPLESASIELN
jgi:hypothetical protein